MRLVGLLLLGLGLLIAWEVLHGQSPIDHVQQLVALFGHQQAPGRPAPAPQQGGATAGGALVTP